MMFIVNKRLGRGLSLLSLGRHNKPLFDTERYVEIKKTSCLRVRFETSKSKVTLSW